MSQLEESIFGDADGLDENGNFTRRSRRAAPPPRRTTKRWLILIMALVVVGAAGVGSVTFLKPVYNGIHDKFFAGNDYPGPGTGEAKVVVKSGDLGNTIGKALVTAGVVKTVESFVQAANDDPKTASAIQPGTYTLKKQMRAADALQALSDPANRFVRRVTIREGLWASETYPILAKASGIPVGEYLKAAKNAKAIGLPAGAKGNVEGWLFPSTYEFPEHSTATQQLAIMVKQTVTELTKMGVQPADFEKTLILASLVEAEARHDVDRPKIARVFLNRIANVGKSPTYGLLQSDASLVYGLHKRSLKITQSQLDDQSNPYNLRFKTGLPPGPISNPGKASIDAAAKPAAGPWYFFVAVNPDTGETKYATTIQEHDANVAEFQKWCSANPGKC